ncbi:MAG: DoxX family protein [Saprospiraceae bacterium]
MNKKIINWILTGLVSAVFIFSASNKILQSDEALQMSENIGLNSQTYFTLGVIEIIAVILFIIPRTGVIGFLLLACYMGGAIATILEQGQNFIFPAIVEAFLWVVAFLRFPELGTRLLKGKID